MRSGGPAIAVTVTWDVMELLDDSALKTPRKIATWLKSKSRVVLAKECIVQDLCSVGFAFISRKCNLIAIVISLRVYVYT